MSDSDNIPDPRRKQNIKLARRIEKHPINSPKTVERIETLKKDIRAAKHENPPWIQHAKSVRDTFYRKQSEAKKAKEADAEAAPAVNADNVSDTVIDAAGRPPRHVRQDAATETPFMTTTAGKKPDVFERAKRLETGTQPIHPAPIHTGQDIHNHFLKNAPHVSGLANTTRRVKRDVVTNATRVNRTLGTKAKIVRQNETLDVVPQPTVTPCPQLYDPCTQEPIADLATLKTRVRALENAADTTAVGKYGLSNDTTNFDFLIGPFLDKSVLLEDMVTFRLGRGGQIGSDLYEVLCRLFVFFGGIPGINPRQDGDYKFMEKVEATVPKVFDTPREAFEQMTCKATSKSGVSDITLTRNNDIDTGGTIPRTIQSPYCETDCEDVDDEAIIKTYLISVKWYKKEKNAENYDLEKLKAVADILLQSVERKPYEIIVFLKSIAEFNRAHQRASRQFMRGIGRTYFGWDENVKPFLQTIRSQIFDEADRTGTSPSTVLIDRYFKEYAKPSLNLQLHQEIIVKSTINAIQTCEDTLFVVGVLPRGGKTYIAGGIIRELMSTHKATSSRPLNILWLTAAPNETRDQVRKDLINKFSDFNDVDFVDVIDSRRATASTNHTLFFCSTQLLLQLGTASMSASAASAAASRAEKRSYITALMEKTGGIDLIFYDEAHKTAVGDKTGDEVSRIVAAYRSEAIRLPFIFLTATYFNLLLEYNIRPENTFVWTYTDVLKSRGLATEFEQQAALENLKTRFNDKDTGIVTSILERRQANGETINAMGIPYLEFPELLFISAEFQEEALERFKEQNVYRPSSGFSLGTLFATRPESTLLDIHTVGGGKRIRADADNVFINKTFPRTLIALLTPGSERFEDEEPGGEPLTKEAGAFIEPSILGRIDELSRSAKSRFRTDESSTLLMFLPAHGDGSRIYFTMCGWAALLMKHPWWRKRYEIACVVDIQTLPLPKSETIAATSRISRKHDMAPGIHFITGSDPKGQIFILERKLHCSSPSKGLVILAGQKLSMGVSLPCTDVVFLLNDSKSPDDIIQKMYRGLTPNPGKTAAFVVDLNPVRSLAAVYGYTRVSNITANTSTEILKIIYDSYSWDADYFDLSVAKGSGARPQRFETHLQTLFEKAQKDPANQMKENESKLEKNLRNNIRRRLENDSEMMSTIARPFGEARSDKDPIKLLYGASATMKSGRLIIRVPVSVPVPNKGIDSTIATEAAAGPSKAKEIVIENFTETVTDFIHYLAITSKRNTLKEALEDYESKNPSLKRDVNFLIYQRANLKETYIHPDILADVLLTTVKTFFQRSERMFRDTKGKVDDTEARMNAVLQIIHKRLTPRHTQKKDYGEVFTPLDLVNLMLDHLPKSVWANKELTWLDPANGIGNFPVAVFIRLDEGLKGVLPNAQIRRKHIVEKMLFMIELQPSNTRIARQNFNKMCPGATPNLLTANTLSLTPDTPMSKGWPATFDIIVGNPPFQNLQKAEGKRGGGDELYMKFVEFSIERLKSNGFLVFVHPPSWRKPAFQEGRKISKNAGMFNKMAHENQLIYLEIHDAIDGKKAFQAATRFDFYVLQKRIAYKPTKVKDQLGKTIDIDLKHFNFLPNFNLEQVSTLLSTDDTCMLGDCILFERSSYGSDKNWVSPEENSVYKFPLIHSTPIGGPRFMYSSRNDNGFFGIPKVIFGEAGINTPVVDLDGKYGMTQGAMAITVANKIDAEKLVRFLTSNFFKNIVEACSWGGYRIDWRLFTYFKKNFWNVDLSIDEPVIQTFDNAHDRGHKGGKIRFTRKVKRV